jgi:hypothetical protein
MRRIRHSAVLAAPLLWAAVLAGCETAAPTPPRLSQGAGSLESLGDSVWQGLAHGDTAALSRMKVTEHEHNRVMWPEMPASNPEANFPVEVAWRNIRARDRAAMAHLLPTYAGSDARLRATRCAGEPRRYESYEALTDCHLMLETRDGEELRVQAFRYVVRMDGRYKVVRYYGEE